MRAVLEEKAPSLLDSNGGCSKVSVRHGAYLLEKADMSYRKKNSSKIMPPPADVADARNKFYTDLTSAFDEPVDERLVLNFDQTMQLFNPSRGYTWEKRSSPRVQIAGSKEGFTLLLVVAASGIVRAQLIFDGKTAASLPTIAPGALLHYEQTPNHWSNEATTLKMWNSVILPYIASRRSALNRPDAPAVVLADAFPAHWTPYVMALVASQQSIAYIAVPDNLTHVFQPLDLGIIAAMKNTVLRRQDEFLQGELQAAIREGRSIVLSKSKPVLRNRVTMFIKEALYDDAVCAASCCRSGFARAGVIRVLFGDSEAIPDVDAVVPPLLCSECAEPAIARDFVPACSCFANIDAAVLCDGCFHNHSTLCPHD